MAKTILLLSLVALTFSCLAFAFEPSPLQDFCVADTTSPGKLISTIFKCKNNIFLIFHVNEI